MDTAGSATEEEQNLEGETKGKDRGGGGGRGGKGGKGGVAGMQGGEEAVAQWVAVAEGGRGGKGGNREKEPVLHGFGASISNKRSNMLGCP